MILETKGYNFNHIEKMNILTIANKLDMAYGFYMKLQMCSLEWKLNAMIKKQNFDKRNSTRLGDII